MSRNDVTKDFGLMDVLEFFLRAWKWIAFYCVLVGAVTFYQYKKNPSYSANGFLFFEFGSSNTVQKVAEKFSGFHNYGDDPIQKLEKYLLLLNSRPLSQDIAANLLKQENYKEVVKALEVPMTEDGSVDRRTLGEVILATAVFERYGQESIKISVTLPDPKKSVLLTNSIQKAVMDTIIGMESKDLQSARDFLDSQIAEVERRQALLDEAIGSIRSTHHMRSGKENNKGLEGIQIRINDLESRLVQLRVEFTQNKALIAEAESIVAEQVDAKTPPIDKFGPESSLVSLNRKNRLLRLQIESAEKILKDLLSVEAATPRDEKAIEDLYKKKELEYQMFADLKKEVMNLDVQKISVQNRVKVLEWARPDTVYTRGIMPTMAKRMIFTVIMACLFVYLLDMYHPLLRGRRDLQGMKMAYLGSIPDLNRRRTGSLYKTFLFKLFPRKDRRRRGSSMHFMELQPDSLFDIVYKNLNAHIINFRSKDRKAPKVIAVMSPGMSEGKSSLSSNISKTLGRAGYRVLLIDADLRRRSVSTSMGLEQNDGLADYLKDPRVERAKPLVIKADGNLEILPAGHYAGKSTELLSNKFFDEMVGALKHFYDYIVIDTPPAVPYSEVISIARASDLVVLSLMVKKTRVDAIETTLEKLRFASTTPIAYVLNRHDQGRLDAYYPYYRQDSAA